MRTKARTRNSRNQKVMWLALAISSAAIYPAAADECSDMMGKVTAALATTDVSSQDAASVEEMRASALQKQNAGDVQGCVSDLQEAAQLLNLE